MKTYKIKLSHNENGFEEYIVEALNMEQAESIAKKSFENYFGKDTQEKEKRMYASPSGKEIIRFEIEELENKKNVI